MIERKWLGDKTGQGFYKRVGKEKEIHAHRSGRRSNIIRRQGQIPVGGSRAQHRGFGRAPQGSGQGRRSRRHVPVEAVQRSVPLFRRDACPRFRTASSRSIAPCAGATRTSWGHLSCGTRSDLKYVCERLEAERRNIPENIHAMLAARAPSRSTSFADAQRRAGTRILRFSDRAHTRIWKRAPACWCSPI